MNNHKQLIWLILPASWPNTNIMVYIIYVNMDSCLDTNWTSKPALQGISEMRTELGLPPQGTNLKVRREFHRFCSDLQWLMVKCSERMLMVLKDGMVEYRNRYIWCLPACACPLRPTSRSAQHWTLLDLWHPRANNCAQIETHHLQQNLPLWHPFAPY